MTAFDSTEIILKQGDITKETSDAIVNAANSSLMGGGGVDGAIHRAGGPKILEECKKICAEKEARGISVACHTGEAVITTGGTLPAKYVIHTVGPHGSDPNRDKLLRNAYLNSLQIAIEHGVRTIAFPAISTGIYGFPIEEAAPIALRAVHDFTLQNKPLKEVRFILFSKEDYQVYESALKKLLGQQG